MNSLTFFLIFVVIPLVIVPSIFGFFDPTVSNSFIFQLLVALVVVIVLYVITLFVLKSDSILASIDNKVEPNGVTTLVDGYASCAQLANATFNGINANSRNYKMMGKSINSRGGVSMTYQFWIKIKDTNDTLYANQTILLKGDKRKYQVGSYSNGSLVNAASADYAVKCPLIKFGSSYRELVVQFATNNVPNYSVDIVMHPSTTDGEPHRNALSLLPLNWFLWTFVFEDSFSLLDGSKNGAKFTFYINDFPYSINSGTSDPLLRNNFITQNDAPLHLFPNLTSVGDFMQISNLKYFNSAVSPDDVRKTYQNGPPTNPMTTAKKQNIQPAILSAYNTLDIYNR